VTEDQIESILQVRRKRGEIFGEGLFSDPAWDILLELFAAELGKRKLGLPDLAHIAPRSTVARWVAKLEEMRLVVCDGDPLRPDDFSIALSRECSAKMSAYLSAAPLLARLE
jgi:DNA-binding IclR family transcriptional regulator